MNSSLLFNITTVAYFAAMLVFIVYLTSKNKAVGFVATLICWVGFVANTGAIGMRWVEAYGMGYEQAPLSNLKIDQEKKTTDSYRLESGACS